MRIVGGSPAAKRKRRAISGAGLPPTEEIQKPDRTFFNKHNTIDPFIYPLLCSLMKRVEQ
jgi:hypothetical protein